jgi:hypothetical protein
MTPQQVARLALEWYRANKADPVEVVRRTAGQYCYSPEQTEAALAHLWAIWPDYLPRPAGGAQ